MSCSHKTQFSKELQKDATRTNLQRSISNLGKMGRFSYPFHSHEKRLQVVCTYHGSLLLAQGKLSSLTMVRQAHQPTVDAKAARTAAFFIRSIHSCRHRYRSECIAVFPRPCISVLSPYYLRSISLASPFLLRCISLASPFHLRCFSVPCK